MLLLVLVFHTPVKMYHMNRLATEDVPRPLHLQLIPMGKVFQQQAFSKHVLSNWQNISKWKPC